MSKYSPLEDYLLRQGARRVTLSFDDVAHVIGDVLPASATTHAEWWGNTQDAGHVQAKAWLGAGWKVDSVSLNQQRVVFVRIDSGASVKRCARCDSEYDGSYDGCPQCARPDEDERSARRLERRSSVFSSYAGPMVALVFGGAAILFATTQPSVMAVGIGTMSSAVLFGLVGYRRLQQLQSVDEKCVDGTAKSVESYDLRVLFLGGLGVLLFAILSFAVLRTVALPTASPRAAKGLCSDGMSWVRLRGHR